MSDTVHYFNVLLGLGTIALQIFSAIALFLLFWGFKGNKKNKYLSFIKNNFLVIGFFISLSAVLVSLFYSEVLHYAPCFHCWVDRIFIFPQVIIFAVALYRAEKTVIFYSLILSLLG